MLLAEVGAELWAAVPLGRGPALADPFSPTAEMVELLGARAAQLRADAAAARPGVLPRMLLGLAARGRLTAASDQPGEVPRAEAQPAGLSPRKRSGRVQPPWPART